MTTATIIAIVMGTIVISIIFSALFFKFRTRKKLEFMVDALEDNETNFNFIESGRNKVLNQTLNRLRGIFNRDVDNFRQQEKFYGQMLDQVKSGVLVYDIETERIIYCNSIALSLLGVSVLSSLKSLSNIDPSLYEAFSNVSENSSKKASLFNESSLVHLSLDASFSCIKGTNVKIVSFNDISDAIEQNESDSWSKLIRVLTHEIMNTVTPIASLSETLQKFENSSPEIKSGLETITTSSRGLISFVESYRKLTRVATPLKKPFYVRDMVTNVIELIKPTVNEANVKVVFEEKSDDVLLYADEGQISQIIINIVKNGIQAGAHNILITTEIDSSESTLINIGNDGVPLSKTSRDEIFVPFFTTKQEGTGIGLSLSRQIMRLHGGSIRLTQSDERMTNFCLTFN